MQMFKHLFFQMTTSVSEN